MNKIQQAYEQGLRVRCSYWIKKCWIKKHSETGTIDEVGCISDINWNFKTNQNNWEIYHEDIPLLKDQPEIKAQIQTHLNQIQELLKQL